MGPFCRKGPLLVCGQETPSSGGSGNTPHSTAAAARLLGDPTDARWGNRFKEDYRFA